MLSVVSTLWLLIGEDHIFFKANVIIVNVAPVCWRCSRFRGHPSSCRPVTWREWPCRLLSICLRPSASTRPYPVKMVESCFHQVSLALSCRWLGEATNFKEGGGVELYYQRSALEEEPHVEKNLKMKDVKPISRILTAEMRCILQIFMNRFHHFARVKCHKLKYTMKYVCCRNFRFCLKIMLFAYPTPSGDAHGPASSPSLHQASANWTSNFVCLQL